MRTQLIESSEYKDAIHYLVQNLPVVLPSETVYGIAANAESNIACGNIFRLKKRPADNPLIVHCSDIEMAKQCMATTMDVLDDNKQEILDKRYKHARAKALKILQVFSPGPISVIVFASDNICSVARSGGATVALRIPAHPVFRKVIASFAKPLAAPSANLSGFPSPTNALMAWEAMSTRVPAIVDGGMCDIGLESTIIDCTGLLATSIDSHDDDNTVYIVRNGSIREEHIIERTELTVENATTPALIANGKEKCFNNRSSVKIIFPGTSYRHYAPKAKIIPITSWDENMQEQILQSILAEQVNKGTLGLVLGPIINRNENLFQSRIQKGESAIQFQMTRVFSTWAELEQKLYEYFATSDRLAVDVLFVSCPENKDMYRALYDRIQRASGI